MAPHADEQTEFSGCLKGRTASESSSVFELHSSAADNVLALTPWTVPEIEFPQKEHKRLETCQIGQTQYATMSWEDHLAAGHGRTGSPGDRSSRQNSTDLHHRAANPVTPQSAPEGADAHTAAAADARSGEVGRVTSRFKRINLKGKPGQERVQGPPTVAETLRAGTSLREDALSMVPCKIHVHSETQLRNTACI